MFFIQFLLRNIPSDDVLSFELLPHLTLHDLAQLDVAVTNRLTRPLLLEGYNVTV